MAVSIIDNVMNIDEGTLAESQMSHGSTSRVVMALESFLESVDLSEGNYTQSKSNLGVEVQDLPVSDLGSGFSFYNPTSTTDSPNMTISIIEGENPEETIAASLELPASIADHPVLQGLLFDWTLLSILILLER